VVRFMDAVLAHATVPVALTVSSVVVGLGCLSAPGMVVAAVEGSYREVPVDTAIPAPDFRTVVVAISVVIGALIVVLVTRAFLLPDNTVKCHSALRSALTIEDSADVAIHLGRLLSHAIKLQTISYDATDSRESDSAEFLRLHAMLEASFPAFHDSDHVTKEVIGEYSLLYTWKGSNPDAPPVILCAHLDVVPAEGTDLTRWLHRPFAGHIDDEGTVWGRGAIDNKHNVIAQLFAAEHLISTGDIVAPRRTIYFCMGHDEEIGGQGGARLIAEKLRCRGVKAEFVLDEGSFIVNNLLPGIDRPVALISHCEKGAVNFRLTVDCFPPGHSSAPPIESNVGLLARAISRLERKPFPIDARYMVGGLHWIASSLSFPLRLVLANMWLFGPIFRRIAASDAKVSSTTRTTTAVTVVHAGEKVNQVAGSAVAYVNHRILPSKGVEGLAHQPDADRDAVLRYDKKVIADDRVGIEILPQWIPASPVSSTHSRAFKMIRQAVHDIEPNALSAPFIMTGNTDTRWYWQLADDIYRFTPLVLDRADLDMFHGINERISTTKLPRLARFYEHLIRSVDGWENSTAKDRKHT